MLHVKSKLGWHGVVCAALCMLVGCAKSGAGKDSAVRPSPPPSTEAQVDVTLVGGARLNPNQTGDARPVQVCVYVVRNSNWIVPDTYAEPACASKRDDGDIVLAERRILAPNQLQQLSFRVQSDSDLWLFIDADYAMQAPEYAPLKLRIRPDAHLGNRLAAWLDGGRIRDADDSGASAAPSSPSRTLATARKPAAAMPNHSIYLPSTQILVGKRLLVTQDDMHEFQIDPSAPPIGSTP